ncbi:dephospho-CoA kinase [Trueperella pyogenes]|uniref:dephospho-CoA kinase n=1 Tax=Trueperella pyogenes TaxID=1661 RepID=UPI002168DD54|nr:dephospho-CoA kinase [Trueperella pyogenes]UVJ52859.1 dephospho-CoA kinase [Trueperella pyogenes]WHU59461.1 dephospho-CoA kinase [Trueperella pyogenes]
MLTIALTGGIGSGKSHVAAIWAGLGAHVVDADQVAREVLSGGQIREAIKRRWGDGVVKAEGTLNREALAAIVFQDPAERAALDAITHPAIWDAVKGKIDAALGEDPAAVIVYDVPLLFGYGREFEMMANVSIAADEEIRIERLTRNRGMSRQTARARIDSQATDAERGRICDLVISNDDDRAAVRAAAETAWHEWIVPFNDALMNKTWAAGTLSHAALRVNDDVGVHLERFRYRGLHAEHRADGLIVEGPEESLLTAGWFEEGSRWRLANPALDMTAQRRDSLSA